MGSVDFAFTVNDTVAVSPGARVPSVHETVPALWLQVVPPEQLAKSVFAGTESLTTTPVAVPDPLFSTVIEYVIASPGLTVAPSPGVFDLTIVSVGLPTKVETSGELTVCPPAAISARFTTGFGAPIG